MSKVQKKSFQAIHKIPGITKSLQYLVEELALRELCREPLPYSNSRSATALIVRKLAFLSSQTINGKSIECLFLTPLGQAYHDWLMEKYETVS